MNDAIPTRRAMLTLAGLFRLGSLIRHIPHAVTVGFKNTQEIDEAITNLNQALA